MFRYKCLLCDAQELRRKKTGEKVGPRNVAYIEKQEMCTCTNIQQLELEQAQRRAAGNRSEHKYSKKYVFISKNMTFGPLGHVLTLLNGPQIHIF